MLAQIRDMPRPDDPARQVYDYAHYQDHLAIAAQIQKTKGMTLILRPIFPVADLKVFLQSHQAMHDDMSRIESLAREDLTQLDDNDDARRRRWSWKNYTQHLAIHQVLKI